MGLPRELALGRSQKVVFLRQLPQHSRVLPEPRARIFQGFERQLLRLSR